MERRIIWNAEFQKDCGKTTSYFQEELNLIRENNGGILIISKGVYLVGSLFIPSYTTLILEEGVILQGSQKLSDYAVKNSRVAGIDMDWPLAILNIYEESNVKVSGPGVIDGNGEVWWQQYWGEDKKGGIRKEYELKDLRWVVDYDCLRPRNILVYKSKNVQLTNFTSNYSGFWNTHICYSEEITIRNLRIENGNGPSTDGIDIDSCRKVLVEKCRVSCNDDNICIKSGRGRKAMELSKVCENITIRDCLIEKGEGVTIGSEVTGGIRDISVKNISFSGTNQGLRIKSSKNRGGFIENISIDGLTIHDVKSPILFDLSWNPLYSQGKLDQLDYHQIPGYWKELLWESPTLTEIKNISIRNVTIQSQFSNQIFSVNGYKNEPITRLSIADVTSIGGEFGTILGVSSLKLANIDIKNGGI